MKKSVYVFLCVLIVALIGFAFFKKNTIAPSRSVTLVRKNLIASVIEKGRVQSFHTFLIVAKSEARVMSIPVKEGQWVKRGDSLLFLDSSFAIQKLNESKGQFLSKTVELNRCVDALRHKQVLFDAGAVSRAEFNEARRQLEFSKAQLSIAEAQLATARLVLQTLIYTAPDRLQVTQVAIEKGAVISPGMSLLQLVDPYHLKVEVRVEEFDSAAVKVGQVAWVTLASNKQFRIPSIVSHVQPILEKIGETYSMKAVVEFVVTQNVWVKPGSQVDVEIITGTASQAWTLPLTAVLFEGGHYFVQIQTSQGIHKKEVNVGLQTAHDIEIISGLLPHQRVLLP